MQLMILRRFEMKRFISVIISCVFFVALTSGYSFAQMDNGMKDEQKGEMKQQGMKMDEEMMKQMMEKCQPMMKQMMADKKEMMQMMMGMMNMQEKMMKGPKAAEKKQMMKDMAQMKEKMQMMMSMPMDMTGMDDSQSKLKCAEQWLKKAIDLHESHMKDPTTTTDASQMELMDQIKKAYGCITGAGPEMSGTQSKEVEGKEPEKAEPSETDPHKH
jgi:DNA polymerase III gamma/tau subunit